MWTARCSGDLWISDNHESVCRHFNRLVCARLGPASGNPRAAVRAQETGRRITDDERCTLFYNLMTIKCSSGRPDKSMPEKALKGTGYAPGVSRLGVAKA